MTNQNFSMGHSLCTHGQTNSWIEKWLTISNFVFCTLGVAGHVLASSVSLGVYCSLLKKIYPPPICACKMQSKPDSWWTYLTSMFDIATRYMLYVRCERTGCIVPGFPIQAPIYLYTKTAITCRSITELCRVTSLFITWWKRSIGSLSNFTWMSAHHLQSCLILKNKCWLKCAEMVEIQCTYRWISWRILPWELEGITSPCCLLIGQYPHYMTLCPPVA